MPNGITINIVRLNAGETEVGMEEGQTYADVLRKVREEQGENITLQNRGENIEEHLDEKLKDGDKFNAIPRQYKQG